MIRFILAMACVVVGVIVGPYAYGNPAMNSADLIVVAAVLGVAGFGLPIGRRDP